MTVILRLTLDELRTRRSAKWRTYAPEVLPLFVAEMDVSLAPAIADVLTDMVRRGDTGYVQPGGLAHAYASFADARWGMRVDPRMVFVLQDVMRGVLELLQVMTEPGAGVVVNPPVYAPFFRTVESAGRRIVEVPLLHTADGYTLDLAGLRSAYAAGARAHLLCSPHNPVGRCWSAEELTAVCELAQEYDVQLLVDEIHGPLTYAPHVFTPVHTLAHPHAQDAVSFASTSKAWNVAGLKTALVVACSDRTWAAVASLGEEVSDGAGILGVAASTAAFTDGREWLDRLLLELTAQRDLLGTLLAEHLPAVRWTPQSTASTYLAWLDCSALGLDDPAAHFLKEAEVALEPGTTFGTGGEQHVRLNFATSPEILEAAVHRLAASLT